MLHSSKGWFVICIPFLFCCSTQTKLEAWKEVCALNQSYLEKPTEILLQIQNKVRNKNTLKVLSEITDTEGLQKELLSKGFSKENCEILRPIPKVDEVKEVIKCTEVGCMDGLSFYFEPNITYPGNYLFTFTFKDISLSCEFSLYKDTKNEKCYGSRIDVMSHDSTQDKRLRVIESISIEQYIPKTINVRIDREGTTILDSKYTPEYRAFSPNQEGCGPFCSSGNQKITISNNNMK
jgi:hypothetical protein